MDSNPRSPVRETSIFEICPFDITFPLPREGPRVRIRHLPPLLPSRPLRLLRNGRSNFLLPTNLPLIGSWIGVDSRERQGTSPAAYPNRDRDAGGGFTHRARNTSPIRLPARRPGALPPTYPSRAREAPSAPPRLAGSLRRNPSDHRQAPDRQAQRRFQGPPECPAGTGPGGFPPRG
jgi:hypothetical protein